eukprot:2308100-Prymnesium_polylepis.2
MMRMLVVGAVLQTSIALHVPARRAALARAPQSCVPTSDEEAPTPLPKTGGYIRFCDVWSCRSSCLPFSMQSSHFCFGLVLAGGHDGAQGSRNFRTTRAEDAAVERGPVDGRPHLQLQPRCSRVQRLLEIRDALHDRGEPR